MSIQITPMTLADYAEVRRLWENTPGMGLNAVDDSRAGIERYLRRNPYTSFVARQEGTLAGAVLAGHDGRRGYLHHAAVAENARRKGVGRQLIETAVAALQAEGISKAALVVFQNNGPASHFWERLGFSERTDLAYRDRVIAPGEGK